MKATLRTVAEAAGVSIATVDRVLNRREGVRPLTIEKVEAAIRDLGYAPSSLVARVQTAPSRFIFVLPRGHNPFFAAQERAIGQLAEQLPFKNSSFDIRHVDVFDGEAIAAALKDIRQSDCDGVAVAALDHPSVREAINTLKAGGIAVVTLVSDVPSSRRDRFIGIDNTAAGRTAGSLLGRFLPHRTGKVAMLAGSLALRDHAERRFGFEQVITQDFPGVEIIALREARDDPNTVHGMIEEILKEHPDLAGIYNVGAGNAGVISTLEASGRARDIVFVAHELTDESRSALIRGTMDAVIHQDPGHEIRSAARILQSLTSDWTIVDDQERIRIDIFLRDNLL